MNKQANEFEVPVIDDPHASEVFAGDVLGYYINAGNIHLTFANERVDYTTSPTKVYRVVTSRIVIPIERAQKLAEELFNILAVQGSGSVPVPDKAKMQ